MNEDHRILSLDGGGIRGLIQARVLQKLEEETGRSIHELFDLIVGTSTGGILAASLACPSHPWTAKEIADFYREDGKKIFGKFWQFTRYPTCWQECPVLRRITDIFGPKYDSRPLEEILKKRFDKKRLADTVPELVVTSYDIERRKPYFFKTTKAKNATSTSDNHLLIDVVRATTSAPTYFQPLKLGVGDRRRVLIDGGVFANNPSMIAISEALSEGKRDIGQIVLCSIGSGRNDRPYRYRRAKYWGLLGWSRRLIYVMLDGMSDSAHYHAVNLLREDERYFRFGGVELEHVNDDIDDVSDDNIKELENLANEIIKKERDKFKKLCKLL